MAVPAEPWTARSLSRLLRDNPGLDLRQVRQVQAQLYRRDLHRDAVLVTQLVTASSAAGAMDYAARLFHSAPNPDLVLCNSMLNAYTLNSSPRSALLFYAREVLDRGLPPDRYTFAALLKACAATANGALGAQVHASLAKTAGASADVFALNALLDMYSKCGRADLAGQLVASISEPHATTANIALSSLINGGDLPAARALFQAMPRRDQVSWNTMLTAYARAGDVAEASKLFEEMPTRNVATWNAMIAALAQNGRPDEALRVFSEMLTSGTTPDGTTMATALSAACEVDEAADDVVAVARRMTPKPAAVSTALLHLLAKRGEVDAARRVFDEAEAKDLLTWNAMIGAYARNGRPEEAIKLFRGMTAEPDGVTMVGLLDACSQTGALELGEWAHGVIRRNRIPRDVYLDTALVDMYAKCGDLDRARRLFEGMPERDLASWNAMIGGLAAHGRGREAVATLERMERGGVSPNSITFVGVLSACGHGGLADDGLKLFETMQSKHGLAARIEHYGCVVDLLGRAGRLEEARELVRTMSMEPDSAIWGAILAGSVFHKNVSLAEEAAAEIARLDPRREGNYVLLSNAYASARRWGEVERVRAEMRANQLRKSPGWSSVEAAGGVHCFRSGDTAHARFEEIYRAWDELVKEIRPLGYEPDIGALLRRIETEEDREEALFRHSEKLAVSFALISSEKGDSSPIRIVKNLRICGDCHRAMELVSEVARREIIVRDRRRFHHFSHGHCSCGGFW